MTQYKKIIPEERICIECGKKFKTCHFNQKYCSKECNLKKKRLTLHERTCLECGKEFKTSVHNKKYCSKTCYLKYLRDRYWKEDGKHKKSMKFRYLKLRWQILERDNFTCQYCGRNVRDDHVKLQIEHIIPKSKGGTSAPNNLLTSCVECNLGKGDCILIQRKVKHGKTE